ncbi:glycosyltransferase family 4 protein [Empedobacter falsenii]|uniref:glycosyltransferase family 4 protein n=1 Tax=Empedobacter falsenii TaxID=343874 RepID=UPI003A80250B
MNNSRKNILALASWYPSRIFLDNGDFIQRHLRSISTLNNVTLVHAVKDENLKSNFEITDNINENVREIIIYFKPSFFGPFNLIKQIRAFLKGIALVNHFDVIHLNVIYPAGLLSTYLKIKYKKPVILTEHWTNLHPNKFIQLPFYKRLAIKKILNFVDIVLPVSTHLGESIKKINHKVSYQVIPNVVDLERFDYKLDLNSNEIRFLHLSHLGDQHKNISGMLNVAKRLAENNYSFKFYIGGNGGLTPIIHFIKEHKLENYITTFGRLEHHEVNQKMNDADCFVLFSRFENQPCVQAEAFATGLPLIATKVGGIEEFFPNNFGILIESENEDQLFEAMIEVIKGKKFAEAEKMNDYARKLFAKEEIAQQFDDVYTKVLE